MVEKEIRKEGKRKKDKKEKEKEEVWWCNGCFDLMRDSRLVSKTRKWNKSTRSVGA